jgi:hypothetical protein
MGQIRCKSDSVGEVDVVTTRETVSAVHACVQRLLAVVPSSGVALFQALDQQYPFKSLAGREQILYLESTLQGATRWLEPPHPS